MDRRNFKKVVLRQRQFKLKITFRVYSYDQNNEKIGIYNNYIMHSGGYLCGLNESRPPLNFKSQSN